MKAQPEGFMLEIALDWEDPLTSHSAMENFCRISEDFS